MKKAIGYVRISTKEQSNYSLSGQRADITHYCQRNDIDLLGVFEDDGQSAKNFDRLIWQQLEQYIKLNHAGIDYLIVYKYDRFSRNLTEALSMIDKLEKKYKIIILSVTEHLGVHPKSPMFFMFRTQLLLNANNELNYIRERTAFGMHNGAKQGRYLHAAPYGYTNGKDDQKRPLIIPNEEQAYVVKQIFRMYMEGATIEQIRKQITGTFTGRGNSAIQRILTNPTYAGMIKVPSYYDEPEKLVDGVHEPIIDKMTYWAAQGRITGKRNYLQNNEEVPLRGALHCTCGRCMTAGNSKGKTKYYWYYVCLSCKINLSATKLHGQYIGILEELSLEPYQLNYLKEQTEKAIHENLKSNEDRIHKLERELSALDAKIDSIEEKYIDNKLTDADYQKWKSRYSIERMNLAGTIQELEEPVSSAWGKYSSCLERLSDIGFIYNIGTLHAKQSFNRLVFDNKISHVDGSYRTPYLHPLFSLKAPILAEKRLLYVEQPSIFTGKIPEVPQTGIEPVLAFRQTGF